MCHLVKAFRTLVSGEDDELSAAYVHFHKMVDQEHGAVRNATLAVVGQLQKESTIIRTDVLENLALAGRTDVTVQSILANTEHLHKLLGSTMALCTTSTLKSNLFDRSTGNSGTKRDSNEAFIAGFPSKAEASVCEMSSWHWPVVAEI